VPAAPRAPRRLPVRKEKLAGLRLPVGRIERFVREKRPARYLSRGAPVYLAGLLEHVARQILAAGIAEAVAHKTGRVQAKHLDAGIHQPAGDLARLFERDTVFVGGVVA